MKAQQAQPSRLDSLPSQRANAITVQPADAGLQGTAQKSLPVQRLSQLQEAADAYTLQRKVKFQGETKSPNKLREKINSMKDAFRKVLPETEYSGENEADFEALFDGPGKASYAAIVRMQRSAQDYGTFSLNEPQTLVLLYYEIKKSKGETIPSPKGRYQPKFGDREAEKKAAQDAQYQEDIRKALPRSARFFPTALLGAGASMAYYLAVNASSLAPDQTVIIGTVQPWAGARGHTESGVVNHPAPFISPKRDGPGHGDEALMKRADFSLDIQQVIDDSGIRLIRQEIGTVTKVTAARGEIVAADHPGQKLYSIEVGGRPIYALNVVAGLGAGAAWETNQRQYEAFDADPKGREDRPLTQDQLNASANEKDFEGINKVMSLNEFQRSATELYEALQRAKRYCTVFVSGGNAVIDAVTRIISENKANDRGYQLKIIWAMGNNGAAFLEGTDNESTRDSYKDHLADLGKRDAYFDDRTGEVTVNSQKVLQIPSSKNGNFEADFYIHGQGADPRNLTDHFDKASIIDKLAPTLDKNREFGTGMLASVIGAHVENGAHDRSSMRFIGATAETLLAGQQGKGQQGLDEIKRHANELILSFQTVVGTGAFKGAVNASLFDDLDLSTLVADGGKLDGKYAAALADLPGGTAPLFDFSGLKVNPTQLRNSAQGVVRFLKRMEGLATNIPLGSREAGSSLLQQFQEVVGTLPINVLANAQLTPSRSAVETEASFVPSYVTKDANFATDSRTMIAIHIATAYPNLDEKTASYWANRIVKARRVSHGGITADPKRGDQLTGPIPDPYKTGRETTKTFTNAFKKILAEENSKAAAKHL